MSKKYFTIAATAVLALGMSLGACKNKTNSDRYYDDEDEDDVEEVDEDLNEDEAVEEGEKADEAEEEEGIYVPTNDMLTFDVKGPVKQVVVKQGNEEFYIDFDEECDVYHIARKTRDSNMEDAEIDRDDQGRIICVSWESDFPWIYTLGYGDAGGKVTHEMYTNQVGNYIGYFFHYDVNGHDTTADYEQAVHGEVYEAYHYEVVFMSEDHHDNWTRCTMECQEGGHDIYRSITYYNE